MNALTLMQYKYVEYVQSKERETLFETLDKRELKQTQPKKWRGKFVLCCGRRPVGATQTTPEHIDLEYRVPIKNCHKDTSLLYSKYPILKKHCPPVADPLGTPISYKCDHEWFKSFMDGKYQDGDLPRKTFYFKRTTIEMKHAFVKRLYPN